MPSYRGRWVGLDIVRETDLPVLFNWRSDWRELDLWNIGNATASFSEFGHQIALMLSRTNTFLVRRLRDGHPIGLAQMYDLNVLHGWGFFMLYLDPEHRRRVYAAEAGLAFLEQAFAQVPLRKIYADVYEFNEIAYHTAMTAGFEQEGRFKEFFQRDGRYWDCYRLALTRDNWERLRGRVERLVDMQHFIDSAVTVPPQ